MKTSPLLNWCADSLRYFLTGELATTWLDELGQDYWRKLAPRVDASQYELLEVLCASFSQYRQIQAEVLGTPTSKQRMAQAQAFNQISKCWAAIVWKDEAQEDELDI